MESSSRDNLRTINILLMGETGVGKSTFINAFANYLKYGSLTEAAEGELLCLVPTIFTVADHDYKLHTIRVGDGANQATVGESDTQNPGNYLFNIGDVNIRLIDTPGIADTRGSNQDNINFDKLLMHISEFKELHAICILMKPNESRITVMFEYCIKQLLSRLEKSASKNIVFLFTNTKGTNYRPGETFPSLMQLLECTETKPPFVKIPLLKDNMFCIDNELFRLILTLKEGIPCEEEEKRSFLASWEQSSNECMRMVKYIAQLPPHNVLYTVSINEARRLIVHLSQPLADITELIQNNITILQRKKDELKHYSDDMEELKKILYIPVVTLKIDELTQPRTVCTASKCCKVYQVDGEQKYYQEKACCDPCFLKSIPLAIIGAKELIFCQSMLSNSGQIEEVIANVVKNSIMSVRGRTDKIECTVCGCSYKYHKHIYYQSTPIQEKIVDNSVQAQLKNKEGAKAAAEKLIQDIENRSTDYQSEQETINKTTAKFAHFLQTNALTPYNDAYESFLEYTIDKEKSMGIHTDKKRIQMFEEMLRCYTEEKKILDRTFERAKLSDINQTSFISSTDIIEAIKELYKLGNCGAKIEEMFDKQAQARNNENTSEQKEVTVDPNTTSRMFQRILDFF